MKKIIIPAAIIITALAVTGCGKKAIEPSPSPKVSPKATITATTAPAAQGNDSQTKERAADNAENSRHDSISIINGSSEAFYAVYLSETSGGSIGENIIGDTPLGEGEEIVLPFAGDAHDEITIVVEDEGGIRYSAGGIQLSNGLSVELRLENGQLTAITQ